MELVDVFLEKSKHKFLNSLVKLPKEYDWYLGLVIDDDNIDEHIVIEKCNMIYEKTEKHLKLLKIMLIDDYTLLLFGTDPIPYNNNIIGIIKSICKYLDCKMCRINYLKYFKNMVYDAWNEQKYFYLINDNRAYNLKGVNEDN